MGMLNDFIKGLSSYNIWINLAHNDQSRRFRGSTFGVVWLVLQHLFFVLGVGFLWSKIFNIDINSFIPFLSVGIAIWGLITTSFSQGCIVFLSAQGFLKQLPLEKSIFIIRTAYSNLIPGFIGLITAFLLTLALNPSSIGWGIFKILPGLALLIISSLSVTYVMAYIGVRYRDIQHGLPSLFQALFFLTPIVYPLEIMRERGLDFAMYLNPFAALIEIVRAPLLHSTWADPIYYLISVMYIAFFSLLGALLYNKFNQKVVYWV